VGNIGLNCDPLSIASGATCQQQAVCCTNVDQVGCAWIVRVWLTANAILDRFDQLGMQPRQFVRDLYISCVVWDSLFGSVCVVV
jgi:hypothetical protein